MVINVRGKFPVQVENTQTGTQTLRHSDRQTDAQTGRREDRQTDVQTGLQTERQTDRWRDGQCPKRTSDDGYVFRQRTTQRRVNILKHLHT